MKLLALILTVIFESTARAEPVEQRSPADAVMLSAGATAASITMLVAAGKSSNDGFRGPLAIGGLVAFAVGPTLGHAYSGRRGTPASRFA